MYTLAVDVGGTKIAAGVIDSKSEWLSKTTHESQVASASTMYNSLLDSMHAAITEAGLSKEQINKIGIAIPGKINKTQGIAVYQNNLPWRDFPLQSKLLNQFPNAQIALEHDVAAATLGEWAIRELTDELFVYVTISTGIAARMMHQGKQLNGLGFSGEIGFFPVGEADVETTASGSAMEQELSQLYDCMTLQKAFSRWGVGDKNLAAYFEEKADVLASSIFHVMALLDPHTVVLGGGVVNKQPEFYQLILDKFRLLCKHPMQQEWQERLEKSLLLGDSGLYGAAVAE